MTTYIQYKVFKDIASLNLWLKDFQCVVVPGTDNKPIYQCLESGRVLQLCGVQFLGSGESSANGEDDFSFELHCVPVAQYIVGNGDYIK